VRITAIVIISGYDIFEYEWRETAIDLYGNVINMSHALGSCGRRWDGSLGDSL
jgi:hypothetical protein